MHDAWRELARGRPVVFRLEAQPGQGYLILAAEKAAAPTIAFLARHGTGDLALVLTPERFEALGLPVQRPVGEESRFLAGLNGGSRGARAPAAHPEPSGVMLEAISALVQARLPATLPDGLHLLRSHWGGVLVSPTPVDAGIDMARLAGLVPAVAMARLPQPEPAGPAAALEPLAFAAHHGLAVLSLGELIALRRQRAGNRVVAADFSTELPTPFGTFETRIFEDPLTGYNHLALLMGQVRDGEPVLTRVHSECLTGDVLGSLRCDCGPQLHLALERIGAEERGVVVYLRQEGRGIGLYHKLRAYRLQQEGLDTVEANMELGFPADLRDFGLAVQILDQLGVARVRLLTNNPDKIDVLRRSGLEVVERVPLEVKAGADNRHYLATKQAKLGHLLRMDE